MVIIYCFRWTTCKILFYLIGFIFLTLSSAFIFYDPAIVSRPPSSNCI